MARLSAGDKAPDFKLTDQNGKTVSLKDFKGKRVVIYFYPKDDTPGCTKEACQFSELSPKFANLDAEVIGVSADGAESHTRFREKYNLSIDLLSDPSHEVMEKYGAWGEKTLYGKKSIGVIRSTFVISPSGEIERAWYSVKADGHAQAVLGTLS